MNARSTLGFLVVATAMSVVTGCGGTPAAMDDASTHDAAVRDAPHSDTPTCTLDADGDGAFSMTCGGTDCDDSDAMRFPGNTEFCDAANRDEDCDPTTHGLRDVDNDGFSSSACCNDDGAGHLSCEDDCDDARDAVRPTAPEVCNQLDDDCDGAVDEAVTVSLFVDHDHDLHGDATMSIMGCTGARGYSSVGDDCDDTTRAVYPGQYEICDSIDNDCDTVVDDGTVDVPWYLDTDADGFGDPTSATLSSCAPISGRSFLPFDCDDADDLRSPAAAERCNARDDDCDGLANFSIGVNDFEDDDGDHVADITCGGTDCDDRDPEIRPGASERCNRRDDDCDGRLDEACGAPTDAGVDSGAHDSGLHFDAAMFLDAGMMSDAGLPPDAGQLDAFVADTGTPCVPTGLDVCNMLDDDCDNQVDEFVCVPCGMGYSGVDGACSDLDECMLNTDGCDAVATCVNDNGAFHCTCPTNYSVSFPMTHCAWDNGDAVTSMTVTVEGETVTFAPYQGDVEAARSAATATITVQVLAGFVGALTINGTPATPGTPTSVPLAPGLNTFLVQTAPESGSAVGLTTINITRAMSWAELIALRGGNTVPGQGFGSGIAADGDTVVVSAPLEQGGSAGVNGSYNMGGGNNSGAAYVFERRATGWVQTAYLKPANPSHAGFGETLAISGDIIAVGTSSDQTGDTGVGADPFRIVNSADRSIGSVTTYHRTSAGAWVYDTYIKASNAQDRDQFGISIDLSGNTLVVGAPGESSVGTGVNSATQADNTRGASGAAYVFVRTAGDAGTWSQQAYVKASNTGAGDDFGISVAVSADTMVVGAYNENSAIGGINTPGAQTNEGASRAGAVYVFTRTGTTWTQQAYIKAPTPVTNEYFGQRVALDGDTLLVPRYSATVAGATGAGQLLVYTRSGITWTLGQTLTRPTGSIANYHFGVTFAVRGNMLLVGAAGDDSAATGASMTVASDTGATDSGAVYVFQRSGGTFVFDAFVKNLHSFGGFGAHLAIATGGLGQYFVVGTPGHYIYPDYSNNGGAFYVFR